MSAAPPSRTPVSSLRGILVALLAALGCLHLMVADTRGADWSAEGAALACLGIVSLSLTAALVLTRSRWPLIAAIAVSALVVLGLVITRTSGYPLGPFDGMVAPLGAFEIIVLVTASLTLSLSGAGTILGIEHIGPAGARFDTLAPLVVIAAAVPGLAISSWSDDVAYVAGAVHVHGATSIDSSNQHGFAYREELTAEQRRALGEELTAARSAALSTPTLADARAAGWTTVGESVPGGGQMMIDVRRRSQSDVFDPSTPVALLFASSEDDAPIVAVQYEGWTKSTTPPRGFTGQDVLWHLHTGTCLVDGIRFVYDPPHVGESCELLDGSRTNTISWMIRAWVVPGWENPNGTFAHDHPAIR